MCRSFIKVSTLLFIAVWFFSYSANSAEKNILLKPFTLAKIYKNISLIEVSSDVKKQLTAAKFKIVGVYQPHNNAKIFIITNKYLLKKAAKSEYGGFGAAIRISMTQVKNDVQVAFNNPNYMAIAYKMKGNLNSITTKLNNVLGFVQNFGGKGLSKKQLADYRYGVDLEGFGGFLELANFKSHEAALKSVEAGFKRKLKNMEKIYRINIPGKNQTIFGVSLKNNIKDQKYLNDQYVMDIIDNGKLRRNAHLPYEIMVTGKRALMLHPHFRLAINFPDLHMFGRHSFGRLLDLPYVYEEFFVQLVGGIWPIPE